MADTNDTAERWLPILGWEGRYEVSDLGRVRSLARIVPTSGRRVRRHDPRILRPVSTHGYLAVHLSDKPRWVATLYVHRLVAEAFIGPIPPGHDIDHLDFDRGDNRAVNLSITSRAENIGRSRRNGRMPRGESHGIAKVTEAQVAEMRLRYAEGGISQASLGRKYGITQTTAGRILRRAGWPHVA